MDIRAAALVGLGLLIATGVGMMLGTFAALRQNHAGDYSVMTVAMWSFPQKQYFTIF